LASLGTPFRVGLVVVAAAATFAVGLTLIGSNLGRNDGYTLHAYFDDATGLGVRSRVQIAGIPIGQVERIELDPVTARAKVFLHIRKQFRLFADASITKRSESILGDFLLDMRPGNPSQRVLKDGDEIKNVLRQPGVNEIFNTMNKVASDISEVTGNLRRVLGSEEGEENLRAIVTNLAKLSKTLDATVERSSAQLDDILTNFQGFSGDLSTLTRSESGDIVAILQNTRDATAEARDILRTVGDVIGSQNKGELKQGISGIKGSLEKLDHTLANVESITKKIDAGEGTIGHLVNDDKLAKNLDKASTSLTNLFGQVDQLKIEVSERSEFLIGNLNPSGGGGSGLGAANVNTAYNPWTKTYFGIKIQPKPDKWYGIEIVDDPRGVTKLVKVQNQPTYNVKPGDPAPPLYNPFYPDNNTQITTERSLKFSAYLAKRYGPVSGRFGIIENTGGFGVRLHMLNDQLSLALDAFEFANPLKNHPRLKASVDYKFFDHLLITAGADDFVNTPISDSVDKSRIISGRDFFVGAGFFFTDEDLKLVLAAVPLR
jgi:phospholipid/cholesterol/gamma-HCH transport system substrate-binding protein